MATNLLPRRPASQAVLVLAAAAIAFAATLWIGGMLRSDEPGAARSSEAAPSADVRLRVKLPTAGALPRLAPKPRPGASESAGGAPAPVPAGDAPTTVQAPPPPPPGASTRPADEIGHSSTP